MLINQPVSREVWRKLVDALRKAGTTQYVPEYDDSRDTSLNRRYYL